MNYGLTAQQAKRLGTAERHEAVWKAIRKSSQLHAPAVLSKEFHKCVRMRADLDYMIAPHRKRPSRASIGSFERAVFVVFLSRLFRVRPVPRAFASGGKTLAIQA